MQLFPRYALARRLGRPAGPALLLEGSWPAEAQCADRWSLDELPTDRDAAWAGESPEELDAMACDLAALAGDENVPIAGCVARPFACQDGKTFNRTTQSGSATATGQRLALVHALALRYHLAKLLRVVAGLDQAHRAFRPATWRLWQTVGRDLDYGALITSWGEARGITPEIRPCPGPLAHVPPGIYADWWRRSVGRAATACAERMSRTGPSGNELRVVVRGNPAHLGPVAAELRRRGALVWWLEDRLGWRTAARWWPRGVRPLVVELPSSAQADAPLRITEKLTFRGVDLTPAVDAWLASLVERGGIRWLAWSDQVAKRLASLRPHWLVTDEDATPAARGAVLAARQAGAETVVVQHGAPCVRFGFAPLLAGRFCAWGETSAEQLVRWGVSPAKTVVTGAPAHQGLDRVRSLRARRPEPASQGPTVLLLGTVPPRDERPDAAAFPLTTAAYRRLWTECLAELARRRVRAILVRRHPRAVHDPVWEEIRSQYRHLPLRDVADEAFSHLITQADLVLALASSSGVEAALAGCPVIQLLPPGADTVLPCSAWGFWGTAKNGDELAALWDRFAAGATRTDGGAERRISAAWPATTAPGDGPAPTAAARIVAELERALTEIGPSRQPATVPSSVDGAATRARRAA